jgi:hypothetical protein
MTSNTPKIDSKKFRRFEDCKKLVVELKTFKTLYQWTAAFHCLHSSSFQDFLDHFYFSVYVSLLYYSCVLGLRHFCILRRFRLLIGKKKKVFKRFEELLYNR